MPSIAVPLEYDADAAAAADSDGDAAGTPKMCRARVCTDRISAIDCGEDVGAWLSSFLGQPCRLVRQDRNELRTCTMEKDTGGSKEGAGTVAGAGTGPSGAGDGPRAGTVSPSKLSFSNEAQFLVTSTASMAEVNNHAVGGGGDVPVDRFRGNIVLGGGAAFAEDGWAKVSVGSQVFRVVGACQRCQMICVDQATGERTSEPLLSLAKFRRLEGQTYFGQYLVHLPQESSLPFRISTSDAIVAMQ